MAIFSIFSQLPVPLFAVFAGGKNPKPRSQPKTPKGGAVLFEIGSAIMQRDLMTGRELHELFDRSLAELGGPAQRDPDFAIKLQCKQPCRFLGRVGPVESRRAHKIGRQFHLDRFHGLSVAQLQRKGEWALLSGPVRSQGGGG